MSKDKTLILGVGNQYRRDDAVGLEVIKHLQQNPLPDCDLVEGGVDGLALIDTIEQYKRAIIIDAVAMGKAPGTVKLFTPQQAKLKIENDSLSTHGFGVAEVIKFLEKLEITTEVAVLGIEPQDIDYGEGLTEIVKAKLPELIEQLRCATQSPQK